MKDKFEHVHNQLEAKKESLYKGIQLYLSPLRRSEILFIGINPGMGYYNYHNKIVKRFTPLDTFEYVGQKYYLATQTKKLFTELGLETIFNTSVKINQFPFATRNEKDLQTLLAKYDKEFKLYYLSREFVLQAIETVKPKLIICEGKSSFDRLKAILDCTPVEYNEDTFVLRHNDFVAIGYKRHMSHIKNKTELKNKIIQYYKSDT